LAAICPRESSKMYHATLEKNTKFRRNLYFKLCWAPVEFLRMADILADRSAHVGASLPRALSVHGRLLGIMRCRNSKSLDITGRDSRKCNYQGAIPWDDFSKIANFLGE